MFATHYFELTELEHETGIDNYHVVAKEVNGQLILLHKVQHGAASQSHGLQVAKLAGIPANVIKTAQKKLAQLEHHQQQQPHAAQADLFAQLEDPIEEIAPIAEVPSSVIEDALRQLDVDNLTPRQALDALYQLKQQL